MTPKPYLSYTQMNLLERNPDKYREIYIENESRPHYRGMAGGKKLSEALEKESILNDPIFDLVVSKIPKLHHPEFEIGGVLNGVPLYGKMDDFDTKTKKRFIETKSSINPWTQEMVDKNDQITFYCSIIYAKYGIRPESLKIRLVWVEMKKNEMDIPEPTGKVQIFNTRRNLIDIMKISSRQKNAWDKIKEMYMEYLSDIPTI